MIYMIYIVGKMKSIRVPDCHHYQQAQKLKQSCFVTVWLSATTVCKPI